MTATSAATLSGYSTFQMSRSDDQRLDDMREQCALMATLVGRGRAAFDQDPAILPALERTLEILGEAAGRVGDKGRRNFPSIPWRDVVRLRDLLAHHYHRIEPDQIWTIATESVPAVADALGPMVEDGHP